ncbi:MAG: hypothetical protein A2W93_11565 [Bacteroidetes bacterium GWF2_43_63]|nr:MAG: hypothetical protein A2W94_14440 [Bacteroidetes bacterium GWE2_42_42]OFY54907.1 MAG: hypothetical protein A2W93_11565 [Bacteroidetes bacterium GWF2_43_63]HCB63184.1 hypothetical protein [Bacteroidales bacterium]HCY22211.1 hypothetical protein [Bacteroidales bacterium]
MEKKIKSVKATRRQQYLDRFDSAELKEMVFVTEEQHFDEQGRLLSISKYSRPDELEEKIVKSYDGNTVITEYYIDENELSEKSVAEINENGRIVRETMYYADSTESVSEFEYDGERPLKKTTMDIDEYERELSGEHTWTYDGAGNLLREEENEYGELSFYREMKYDDKNRMVAQTTFHAADGKSSHDEMEWEGEEVSHVIKTDIYGNKTESFYKYNAQGDAAHIQFKSKAFNSETVMEYDADNNAIHEKETDDKDEVLYEVFRQFHPETKKLVRVETYINRQGQGTDVHYMLEYEYEFFE